ncbi:MAG TPA: SPFH domain-containing protein [Phycisphaerae bacterium]|nr:SPFH domain-containing protein [Phycisphaerae bacterium]
MDCHCLHNHSPQEDPRGRSHEMSAAHRSLADALHVSFRLLGVAMVVMLIAWLTLTGMSCVDSSERAVRLFLGEITGEGDARVHGDGLLWNWPQPFGEVVRVSTTVKTLEMRDFWMFIPPEEANLRIEDLRPRGQGLDPAQDGALLTGDRGLIHAMFSCKYRAGVARGAQAEGSKATLEGVPSPRAVIDYVTHVADAPGGAEAFVRSAVATAAIRVAAELTVEHIFNAQDQFARNVQEAAQAQLDRLASGIFLNGLEIRGLTVPLGVQEAVKDVTVAKQDEERQRTEAEKEAIKKLSAAAGESWRILAGDLNVLDAGKGPAAATDDVRKSQAELFDAYDRTQRDGEALEAAAVAQEISRFGLLNLYAQAREDDRDELAARVLEQIDRVLMSNLTGGDAGRKINEARNYSTRIRNLAQARAEQFQELLPSFQATPDLTVQRLWADAKTEVLTNKKLEKFFVPRAERFVLHLSEDPEIRARIDREKLKDSQAEQAREQAGAR